jgi:hypothetical protein
MQKTSRIVNLEAADDFFDIRDVDHIPIESTEIVKLCFDHPSMLLLLGCPYCDIHAC